jgi:hypothetical protein
MTPLIVVTTTETIALWLYASVNVIVALPAAAAVTVPDAVPPPCTSIVVETGSEGVDDRRAVRAHENGVADRGGRVCATRTART